MRDVANRIVAHHAQIGEINFYAVELDGDISLGHMKYERDRSSPYDDEFTVANIRFDKTLNRCGRRYVSCKEMMHIFDTADEAVSSRERFIQLLNEFETLPMPKDISPMYLSELNAEWKALLILCPKRLRDKYRGGWEANEVGYSDLDIALKLKIPENLIRSIMSPYYETALQQSIAQN